MTGRVVADVVEGDRPFSDQPTVHTDDSYARAAAGERLAHLRSDEDHPDRSDDHGDEDLHGHRVRSEGGDDRRGTGPDCPEEGEERQVMQLDGDEGDGARIHR